MMAALRAVLHHRGLPLLSSPRVRPRHLRHSLPSQPLLLARPWACRACCALKASPPPRARRQKQAFARHETRSPAAR